jgi:hypothetical protein
MDSDRSQVKAGEPGEVLRAAFPFEIQTAALDDSGKFRVTGIMNSFKVTHSRRILHPRGFEKWLKRNPKATLPMLANHGFDIGGFASIGVWDRFERVKGGGMLWSGYLGENIPLADQARALLEQKILRQLSVGWISRQQRYVRSDDTDLDPHFKQAMEEAGADEALAFLDWYPVEGSIVDVGDDPEARIAAKANAAAVEAALAPLRQEIAELRGQLERLSAAGGGGEPAALLATLRTHSTEFLEDLRDAAVEVLQTDPRLIAAGQVFKEDLDAILEDLTDEDKEKDNDGDGLAGLRERVARFGDKRE